jgi:hypothetical protein
VKLKRLKEFNREHHLLNPLPKPKTGTCGMLGTWALFSNRGGKRGDRIPAAEEERVMTDYSLTKELRYALAAYLDAREGWRLAVEVIEEQFEARDPGSGGLDPNNERVLYQAARARYLGKAGELREGGVRDELTHRARLYLTEFGRLSNALDNLSRYLENASGGKEPGETPVE